MIFNDFDEYFSLGTQKIYDVLKNNNYDCLQFRNIWCSSIDKKIPKSIPFEFKKISSKLPYPKRSKNIYKCTSIYTIGVHDCKKFYKSQKKVLKNLNMYQFYYWTSNPYRKKNLENQIKNDEILTLE